MKNGKKNGNKRHKNGKRSSKNHKKPNSKLCSQCGREPALRGASMGPACTLRSRVTNRKARNCGKWKEGHHGRPSKFSDQELRTLIREQKASA